jgi:predicted enzyme related to lactoylglutathione lyase
MADSGTFYWNEFMATDTDAAEAFFTSVFGWSTDKMDMPQGGQYTVFKNGDQPAAGMMDISNTQAPAGTPAHWFSYIVVDDVDASCAAVKDAGGQVLSEPFDIEGIGRIATIQDPNGGQVGIMTAAG